MPGTPFSDWSVFSQFGIAGLILGVFFVLVVMILRIHAKTIDGIVKRMSKDSLDASEAWRHTVERMEDRADSRQQETNEVMRQLNNGLYGLCHARNSNATKN